MFRSVLADRQQCLAIRSQRIRNRFAINFVGVRGYIAECFATHFGVFATHLWNVRNVFVFCMLHIRITKVWFLTCKKGVFELQKYGFCFLNVALLQFVRRVFAECPPHCCNLFATYPQSVSSAFASVRHVFAICKQRCCNLFASKKPKPSMCIEEFRPPKIL